MDIASARDAGKAAVEVLAELIPEAKHVALEGIEFDGSIRTWKVIVGYMLDSDIPQAALAALGSMRDRRTYKMLVLDEATLELQKMEPYFIGA